MSTNLHIPKNCQYCGNLFTARTTTTRYCSHKCNSRHYKQIKREEKVMSALQETTKQQTKQQSTSLPTKTLSNKDFLSITDASKLIGVSRWTIQRMIKRGQLKAVPFGRKHILARHQIENLFNQ
ncbi:helix-turn-helix domain-containing protein [Aequorivita sp. 609]|uniref:helix-turn-helix domain-containing protein n=1 Tax=Aequorivita TaxID=153265 RepID=UPI0016220907|nr:MULTISPECIES: helix-turn-helix domain-containing protein [Aequorivita]MBB6680055.1 helix-turn-helix domain-containing protein [Aequorivita sp. 609]